MPHELVQRSKAFHNAILEALGERVPANERSRIALALCGIAFSHGHGIAAMLFGNPTVAMALVRLNYEALVRANWVLFGADEAWVETFAVPVVENNEPDFPEMGKMLDSLSKCPACLVSIALSKLKQQAWSAMNSYTHGGQRQVARYLGRYDDDMLEEVMRTVNALYWYAARTAFHAGENEEMGRQLLDVYNTFQDCMHARVAA